MLSTQSASGVTEMLSINRSQSLSNLRNPKNTCPPLANRASVITTTLSTSLNSFASQVEFLLFNMVGKRSLIRFLPLTAKRWTDGQVDLGMQATKLPTECERNFICAFFPFGSQGQTTTINPLNHTIVRVLATCQQESMVTRSVFSDDVDTGHITLAL